MSALATDGARNKLNQYLTVLLALAETAHDMAPDPDTRGRISALIEVLENPPAIFEERSQAVDVLAALQGALRSRHSGSWR